MKNEHDHLCPETLRWVGEQMSQARASLLKTNRRSEAVNAESYALKSWARILKLTASRLAKRQSRIPAHHDELPPFPDDHLDD